MSDKREEIHGIEVALSDLVEAIIGARIRRQHGGVMTMAEALKGEEGKSEIGLAAMDLIDEPVGNACRRAVCVLGERLFEIGGTALMLEVLERVAAEPGSESRRTDILDKNWDGIGADPDFWIA